MNHLRVAFAPYWQSIQHALFPQLERVLGPLTEKQQQLVQTLEVIRIEQMIPRRFRVPGRPPKDRAAMARALVAKAVYDMPTTRVLLDRLDTDVVLRRICGWERRSEVPSESVFSRAFEGAVQRCGHDGADTGCRVPEGRGRGGRDPRGVQEHRRGDEARRSARRDRAHAQAGDLRKGLMRPRRDTTTNHQNKSRWQDSPDK